MISERIELLEEIILKSVFANSNLQLKKVPGQRELS
jgi:hypothetical protein